MSDNELQASIKILKEKLKDMRKKNKILRKENKLILEKVEKYPCCKHIDKRKFSLKPPLNPPRHNLPQEGGPKHAYCQNCDSLKPLFFGEITDTEMRSSSTWLCTKCCDISGPCSFGTEYKILCEVCLVKRKNVKEKNDAIKRKKENSEWAWMQRRNEEHNNRLLYDDSRRSKKKTKTERRS